MAFTLNGIGTTYYGERDWRPDGSYCSTMWFVVVFVPLIPLKSYRLVRNPQADVQAYIYSARGLGVLEVLPLNLGQVLQTYTFTMAVVGWAVLSGWLLLTGLGNKNRPMIADAALLVGWALGLLIPFLLLWRSRRREWNRVLTAALNRTGPQ